MFETAGNGLVVVTIGLLLESFLECSFPFIRLSVSV
jgi:hypothetical protein